MITVGNSEGMMYYGAWINLGGLGVNTPVKLKMDHECDSDGEEVYWVAEGPMKDDFSFEKLGLDVGNGCITFVSEEIKEVQAFIDGIRSVATLMNMNIPSFPDTPLPFTHGGMKQ